MCTMKIEFNPDNILSSIDLWRSATDMKIPVHDEFKLHFIQNRGAILGNFERTTKSWLSVLRAMTPLPESKAEFDPLVAAVEEFGAWATTELEKLQAIALQESMASAIDEGLRDPNMRKILGKLIGPNSRKNPGGK